MLFKKKKKDALPRLFYKGNCRCKLRRTATVCLSRLTLYILAHRVLDHIQHSDVYRADYARIRPLG